MYSSEKFDIDDPLHARLIRNLKNVDLSKLKLSHIYNISPKIYTAILFPKYVIDDDSIIYHGETIIDIDKYINESKLTIRNKYTLFPILDELRFSKIYFNENGNKRLIHKKEDILKVSNRLFPFSYNDELAEIPGYEHDIMIKSFNLSSAHHIYKTLGIVDKDYIEISESVDGLMLRGVFYPQSILHESGSLSIYKAEVSKPFDKNIKLCIDFYSDGFNNILETVQISFVLLNI